MPQRFPPWTKALLCTAFCALGVYVFAGVVDEVYPIDDWLVWPLGAVWLWCLVLNLALFAFGTLLTSRIVGENTLPPLEMAVTSTAVGVVGMGMLMYLAGFLGLLHAWFAVLVVGVMLGLGARPLARLTRRLGAELASMPRPRTLLEHVLTWTTVGWAAWCLTFLYLGSMTPDAINHDASWYHIPIAEDYARAGRIIPFPADYLRAMPHLMSLLYSWAFLVPGLPDRALRWMLTLHIEFSMVMWTLAAVAAGARWMLAGRRVPLLWATFLLFPGIYVYDLHIGGSADHFLGLFTVPCFLATVRAAERFETRRCVLLGVLCAGAVLTKYQALYLLAASAVILVPRWGWLLTVRVLHRSATLRPRLRPAPTRPWALLTGPGSTALVGLLLTAPHFLKNVAFYRNPIYPFAQEVFTQSRPSFETSARLVRGMLTDALGLPQGTLSERLEEAVKVFFTFSFEPHYSFIGNVPVVGSLFTLLLPLGLLVFGRRRIWLGVLAVFTGMLVWGMTQFAERYLQVLTPLMAVVVAALLVRAWGLGWLARVGVVPLVLFQVVWGGDILFIDAWPRIESSVALIRSGHEGKRDAAARYPYLSSARRLGAALPDHAVLLLHSVVRNLGFDREVLLDTVGKQGLIDYDKIADPRGMWELYRSLGITHVAHLWGLPSTHNRAHDVLFIDFITRWAQKRERFGQWELVTVPDRAPPPERPYQVLCLGINYEDGLYGIEQMRVHEIMQPYPDPLPPPKVPLPPQEEAQRALMLRANAVVVGVRYRVGPELKQALNEHFREGVAYPKLFAIWVRR